MAMVLHGLGGVDRVVLGSAGVFVVADHRRDLGHQVRWVRERLDAAGLPAMPAQGRVADDLHAVLAEADGDVRFAPVTMRRAHAAIDPPPFVAAVLEDQLEPPLERDRDGVAQRGVSPEPLH